MSTDETQPKDKTPSNDDHTSSRSRKQKRRRSSSKSSRRARNSERQRMRDRRAAERKQKQNAHEENKKRRQRRRKAEKRWSQIPRESPEDFQRCVLQMARDCIEQSRTCSSLEQSKTLTQQASQTLSLVEESIGSQGTSRRLLREVLETRASLHRASQPKEDHAFPLSNDRMTEIACEALKEVTGESQTVVEAPTHPVILRGSARLQKRYADQKELRRRRWTSTATTSTTSTKQ